MKQNSLQIIKTKVGLIREISRELMLLVDAKRSIEDNNGSIIAIGAIKAAIKDQDDRRRSAEKDLQEFLESISKDINITVKPFEGVLSIEVSYKTRDEEVKSMTLIKNRRLGSLPGSENIEFAWNMGGGLVISTRPSIEQIAAFIILELP